MSLLVKCRWNGLVSTTALKFTRTLSTTRTVSQSLNRISTTFFNKDGLFDKVELVSTLKNSIEKVTVESETDDVQKLRIGLIGAKTSLLDTILADPFASDQSWFEEFKNRDSDVEKFEQEQITEGETVLDSSIAIENRLITYSSSFERVDNVWKLPTPFLNPQSRHGLEFLEFNESSELDGNDGCHLYFSFNDNLLNQTIRQWPVYSWKDSNQTDLSRLPNDINEVKLPKLTIDEINSELSELAIELLRDSPKNSTIYTRLYPYSNIQNFVKTIDQLNNDKDQVLLKLYESVLLNVENQLLKNSLTLKDLDERNVRVVKYIQDWSELTHKEFQTVFKPYVDEFERKNLPWWKLYYKVDEIKKILTLMFDQQLLNESVRNYSYVKGQIDSFTSFTITSQETASDVNTNPFEFVKELKELPTSNSLTRIRTKLVPRTSASLQKEAIKLLLINFLGLQFPVILISILGHTLYDFSAYSMVALGSLGLVAGFNRVSRTWVRSIEDWKSDIFEKIRIAIDEENDSLVKDWESRLNIEKEAVKERHEVVEGLKVEVDELRK